MSLRGSKRSFVLIYKALKARQIKRFSNALENSKTTAKPCGGSLLVVNQSRQQRTISDENEVELQSQTTWRARRI